MFKNVWSVPSPSDHSINKLKSTEPEDTGISTEVLTFLAKIFSTIRYYFYFIEYAALHFNEFASPSSKNAL